MGKHIAYQFKSKRSYYLASFLCFGSIDISICEKYKVALRINIIIVINIYLRLDGSNDPIK
jgi:hypothetical protein